MTEFKARRKALLDKIEDNALIIINSHSEVSRSNDTEFRFRQSSDFYYLTGFNEPNSILVLSKKEGRSKEILFLREKDPLMEQWVGRRLGVEKASEELAFDQAFDIEDYNEEIVDIVKDHSIAYFDLFHDDLTAEVLKDSAKTLAKKYRKKKLRSLTQFKDIKRTIGMMKLYKSKAEIEIMQSAVDITEKAHHGAMALAKEAKNEYEILALIKYIFEKNGSPSEAYTSIVAGGDNANILHYIENNHPLNDGELMLIDAGCEIDNYASDITRTFPINGKFTEAQKEVYQLVLDVEKRAIERVAPGKLLSELHDKATDELIEGLISLGVFKGSVDEVKESGEFKQYWPHGLGHLIGLDVHDDTPYSTEQGVEIPLSEGMVITIEPGLYLPKGDEMVPAKYQGIGVRIEDNIVVTSTGYLNLSSNIAKEIDEVEAICAQSHNDFI